MQKEHGCLDSNVSMCSLDDSKRGHFGSGGGMCCQVVLGGSH